MTTGTAAHALIVERVLPHPQEKIWRALTETTLIAQWLMPNDFLPVAGHRFTLRTDPMPNWNGVSECQVLAAQPYERLSYSWHSSGEAASRIETIVTWTLTPVTGGVLLRMEQSGFRAGQENNYQGAGHGWQRFFAALERVIAGLD